MPRNWLRHKEFGIWNETTNAAYLERVREVAAGLSALGVVRGEKPSYQRALEERHAAGDFSSDI